MILSSRNNLLRYFTGINKDSKRTAAYEKKIRSVYVICSEKYREISVK